jgi:transcription initiation factor IIE alpha subunit
MHILIAQRRKMDEDELAREIEKVITDLRRILDRIEDEKKAKLYGI